MSSKLQEKALRASAAFIERKGLDVLDSAPGSGYADPVALDDGALAFIHVTYSADEDGRFPEEAADREAAEKAAAEWLRKHGDAPADVGVRSDEIALILVGESRALLRYHTNALGGLAS